MKQVSSKIHPPPITPPHDPIFGTLSRRQAESVECPVFTRTQSRMPGKQFGSEGPPFGAHSFLSVAPTPRPLHWDENKSGNVQERSPSLKCVQTWSKTDKSVSKLAQNGSKGVKTGQKVPKRFKRCQNGSKWANEGVREAQNGGEKGKKVMNGLLAHPFSCENGLLSTFQGKGGLRDHFLGVIAHNVNFWAILGSFWGLLGPQTSESAKSRIC